MTEGHLRVTTGTGSVRGVGVNTHCPPSHIHSHIQWDRPKNIQYRSKVWGQYFFFFKKYILLFSKEKGNSASLYK